MTVNAKMMHRTAAKNICLIDTELLHQVIIQLHKLPESAQARTNVINPMKYVR